MIRAIVAATLLASPVAAIPADPLAVLIGDRVAGPAIDCIDASAIDQVHIAAGVGVVYAMRTGRVMYLNEPTAGLAFLRDGVVLAAVRSGPHLCSVDPVRVLNPNSRRPIATLTLGRFVPYRPPVTP